MKKIGPPLSKKELTEFEAEIGYKLPVEYRKFMLENNGGKPESKYFYVPGWQYQQSLVNEFDYIVPDGSGYGIRQILAIKGDIFPEGFISIGGDPGGNHILMCLCEPYRGMIYFWDHEDGPDDRLDRMEDYSNIYLLANSFEEFVNNLKNENEL